MNLVSGMFEHIKGRKAFESNQILLPYFRMREKGGGGRTRLVRITVVAALPHSIV